MKPHAPLPPRHDLINVERALWRSSGGFCANPACRADLLKPLADRLINVGEMAHVIAASSGGPRSSVEPGEREIFENLLLLCRTCHTIVDAAPEEFPVELLVGWKRERERAVLQSAGLACFDERPELDQEISRLLRQNEAIHETYGPDAHADGHPLADAKVAWELDLLVVYRREAVSPADAYGLRGEIETAISAVRNLPPAEILLLTIEEAAQSRFAERESAVELYRSPINR